jgi:hypothetical protein
MRTKRNPPLDEWTHHFSSLGAGILASSSGMRVAHNQRRISRHVVIGPSGPFSIAGGRRVEEKEPLPSPKRTSNWGCVLPVAITSPTARSTLPSLLKSPARTKVGVWLSVATTVLGWNVPSPFPKRSWHRHGLPSASYASRLQRLAGIVTLGSLLLSVTVSLLEEGKARVTG